MNLLSYSSGGELFKMGVKELSGFSAAALLEAPGRTLAFLEATYIPWLVALPSIFKAL